MDSDRHDGFGKDDPLWDLLDHASRPPPPSPYFARRVLREIDAPGASASGWAWLKSFRLAQAWVPVAAAIALVAAAGHFWLPETQSSRTVGIEIVEDDGSLPPNPDQRISAVLTDLDDLIALEENQVGDDDAAWQ
jgi:hypothetical protein